MFCSRFFSIIRSDVAIEGVRKRCQVNIEFVLYFQIESTKLKNSKNLLLIKVKNIYQHCHKSPQSYFYFQTTQLASTSFYYTQKEKIRKENFMICRLTSQIFVFHVFSYENRFVCRLDAVVSALTSSKLS